MESITLTISVILTYLFTSINCNTTLSPATTSSSSTIKSFPITSTFKSIPTTSTIKSFSTSTDKPFATHAGKPFSTTAGTIKSFTSYSTSSTKQPLVSTSTIKSLLHSPPSTTTTKSSFSTSTIKSLHHSPPSTTTTKSSFSTSTIKSLPPASSTIKSPIKLIPSSTTTTKPTIKLTVNSSLSVAAPNTDQLAESSYSQHRFNTKSRDPKQFTQNFAECKRNTPEFDECILEAINSVRSFIPTGLPELNIPAFDPIHAKEVVLRRGGPTINFKLKLKNVSESGWRYSRVTKFRSNLKQNLIQITQYFPDKHLEGDYEVESMFLMPNMNKGKFRLSLYDLNQTTTLSRPKNSKTIKVKVDVQEIGDMKLHITNLLRGRTILEGILDRMINSPAWRPGFVVVRPLVNDLVSTAFTEIYNKVFNNYDFNKILPPS